MIERPDLLSYDWILASSSAGKDSAVMLHRLVDTLDEIGGRRSAIVVAHADLGPQVEWDGVGDLAARHARRYGLRFEVVRAQSDLLGTVLRRGAWPSSSVRWCTSNLKRGPIRTLMTRLAAESRAAGIRDRPIRILNVMGMRAAESAARAKRPSFVHDESASNGRRHVDEWLPIHHLSTAEVWDEVRAHDLEMHPAYAAGMTRLSCRFCVLASKSDLVCAARADPAAAQRYLEVEQRTGHSFRQALPMSKVIELAREAKTATTCRTTPTRGTA